MTMREVFFVTMKYLGVSQIVYAITTLPECVRLLQHLPVQADIVQVALTSAISTCVLHTFAGLVLLSATDWTVGLVWSEPGKRSIRESE